MLEISTDALKVVAGLVAGILTMYFRNRAVMAKQCEHCPEHEKLVEKVNKTEIAIAEINANLRGVFHQLDDIKSNVSKIADKVK